MQIEIAKHSKMSERGSSLLRLIQNNDMPVLDLLVREAIQNSLDASLPGKGFTNININLKKFKTNELSIELEGITQNLVSKFAGTQYLFEIRDANTTGLTGPIQYADVKENKFGNLLKLIYEISMPQQLEGAGGSWGLGKTVYYRVGIGLVIYYSQVKLDDGTYALRMAASLVEDENSPDALINENTCSLRRGIAWWGKGIDKDTTIPLTDKEEINKILKILNIEPFKERETGTSIIIPYIDDKKLLEGIIPSNGDDHDDSTNYWWMSTIADYIRVAVQRWYAPRLLNSRYALGRWLRVSVNGKEIKSDELVPIFKILQDLYNRTPVVLKSNVINDSLMNCEVFIESIKLKNMFHSDTSAGYLAYAKVTRTELLMDYPNNYSHPYAFINKFDHIPGINNPIIMFTRKPGLIVGYETTGKWTESIPITTDGEFIVGIFVVNSTNILKKIDSQMTIEEYIRKSEKADHTTWSDWNIGVYRPNIITKIQTHLSRKISSKFNRKEENNVAGKNIGLGRALAQILLPPENFGNSASTVHKKPTGTGSMNRAKEYSIKIISSPKYMKQYIAMEFEMKCGKMYDTYNLEVVLKTESGALSVDKWEGDSGVEKPFPIRVKEFRISKYSTGKKSPPFKPNNMKVDKYNKQCLVNSFEINVISSNRYKTDYALNIKVPEKTGYTLHGEIIFEVFDAKVQAGLNLHNVGGKNK